jgi:zinc/manganese transport system permease protein
MAGDLFSLMWVPFLMCLVLTGIYAYLGLHVIAREVVFVDIALAQLAALGATGAFLVGFELSSWISYAFALTATLLGAALLALSRSQRRSVSQEAVIGVVYAVAAAGTILVIDRAPHGAEHLKTMLVGNILTVGGKDLLKVAALCVTIGVFHWYARRPFLLISTDPAEAYRQGLSVRLWDFLFYASFGLVVTGSVRIVGILLVFSYLIVPALAGLTWGTRLGVRLVIGWSLGGVVSVVGMLGSALFDLPTGATIGCVFGLALLVLWALSWLRAGGRTQRA